MSNKPVAQIIPDNPNDKLIIDGDVIITGELNVECPVQILGSMGDQTIETGLVYNATTDGFIFGQVTTPSHTEASNILIYADFTDTPTTCIQRIGKETGSSGQLYWPVLVPIRKGQNYRIEKENNPGLSAYWVPFGVV